MTWDPEVRLWWIFLSSVSLMNIVIWFWLRHRLGNRPYLWLSALYVFGCAFRSFLPRADVQRFVIFDSFISSVFVGRSVATIAELGFIAQWAVILMFFSKETRNENIGRIAKIIFPLIFIAEIFSWYAVLTTNYIGSVFEESLWGITFTLISLAVWILKDELEERFKKFASLAIGGLLLYVGYMFIVDVPMYYSRWASDRAAGAPVVSVGEGLHDVLNRWRVSRAHAEWKYEMLWMSLYFSLAVWWSLLMNLVPDLSGRILRKKAG